MAGKSKTPGAVRSATVSNTYIFGALSWMIDARSDGMAANAPIKAIWRNEVGSAGTPTGPRGS